MSSAADLTQPTGSAAAATLQPTALLASLLAERCGAAPRQVSSDRHIKRLAEGGGEVEGWSSCGGRPPPSAQGRGRLAGETSDGSGNEWAFIRFLRGFLRAWGGPLTQPFHTSRWQRCE